MRSKLSCLSMQLVEIPLHDTSWRGNGQGTPKSKWVLLIPRFVFGVRTSTITCSDVIMDAMASQITSLTIVYSTVYSAADQRKHQRSASLTFVRGIHRWPVNSPHQWPVTWKMFPFDDVIRHGYSASCIKPHYKDIYPISSKNWQKWSCHVANRFVTGGTGSYHNDNLWCRRWRQSCHCDFSETVIMGGMDVGNPITHFCLRRTHIIAAIRHNDATWRRGTGPTLFLVMACCLLGAKQLPKPIMVYGQWILGDKLQWKWNQNRKIFIEQHSFETVVCKVSATLFRPDCVKYIVFMIHTGRWAARVSGHCVHPCDYHDDVVTWKRFPHYYALVSTDGFHNNKELWFLSILECWTNNRVVGEWRREEAHVTSLWCSHCKGAKQRGCFKQGSSFIQNWMSFITVTS